MKICVAVMTKHTLFIPVLSLVSPETGHDSQNHDTLLKIVTRPRIRHVGKEHDVSYDLDMNPDRIMSNSLDLGFVGGLGQIQ